MTFDLTRRHRPLFAPPLLLPIHVKPARGLFGIDRKSKPAPEWAGSAWPIAYPIQPHQGIDLYSTARKPVMASRSGEVVHVAGDAADGKIVIRHAPPGGLGYVTRYDHVTERLVSVGDTVRQGEQIGKVEDRKDPVLHFEIHRIVNSGVDDNWERINTEPIDPSPILYPWEKILFEELRGDTPSPGHAWPLTEIGVFRVEGIPMFQVEQQQETYSIPLYDPDPGDARLVSLLQAAHMGGKSVRLASRDSYFFANIRLITAAQVVGD